MATSFSEVRRRFMPGSGAFIFYKDGLEVAREWRDEHGAIIVEGVIPDGIVRTYREDDNGVETGKLLAEWSYRAGKLEGISRMYDEDGRVEEEMVYFEGRLDSIHKMYYEDGHVSFESTENSQGCVSCKQLS